MSVKCMVCCMLGFAKGRREGLKFSLCPQGIDRLAVISSKLFFSVLSKIGAVDKAKNSEGLWMGSISQWPVPIHRWRSHLGIPGGVVAVFWAAADGASGQRCQSYSPFPPPTKPGRKWGSVVLSSPCTSPSGPSRDGEVLPRIFV